MYARLVEPPGDPACAAGPLGTSSVLRALSMQVWPAAPSDWPSAWPCPANRDSAGFSAVWPFQLCVSAVAVFGYQNTLSLSLKENHQRESFFVFRRSAFLFDDLRQMCFDDGHCVLEADHISFYVESRKNEQFEGSWVTIAPTHTRPTRTCPGGLHICLPAA